MPDVRNPSDEWLPKVAAELIHVDEGENGLNVEARANLWGFGFPTEELLGVTEDDVMRFLREL